MMLIKWILKSEDKNAALAARLEQLAAARSAPLNGGKKKYA